MTKLITEIERIEDVIQLAQKREDFIFQKVDFTSLKMNWHAFPFNSAYFLGCQLSDEDKLYLINKGAVIFEEPPKLPYTVFRKSLYSWQELLHPSQKNAGESVDYDIYEHFSATRLNIPLDEALWQRLHDHSIDDALRDYIELEDNGLPNKKVVAIMGGHSTKRTDRYYLEVVRLTKRLTEAGFLVASGGGPGIMEAANLGAYMAHRSASDVDRAMELLRKSPHYSDPSFTENALEVLALYPEGAESLAIPTWFYGHEPSNVFASHIAKYFSNSIREDTLLSIAIYGVIFAPGSAGTVQEIFMDAAQNHYATFDYISPMIFLGSQHYLYDTMLYPILRKLAYGNAYHDLMLCTDDVPSIVDFIKKYKPKKT